MRTLPHVSNQHVSHVSLTDHTYHTYITTRITCASHTHTTTRITHVSHTHIITRIITRVIISITRNCRLWVCRCIHINKVNYNIFINSGFVGSWETTIFFQMRIRVRDENNKNNTDILFNYVYYPSYRESVWLKLQSTLLQAESNRLLSFSYPYFSENYANCRNTNAFLQHLAILRNIFFMVGRVVGPEGGRRAGRSCGLGRGTKCCEVHGLWGYTREGRSVALRAKLGYILPFQDNWTGNEKYGKYYIRKNADILNVSLVLSS